MRKRQVSILLMAVFFLIFAVFTVQCTKVQTNEQDTRVREMAVTGKIAKGRNNYIIRGKVPSMVLTILNPEPKILDEYAKNGKIVDIDVWIVSGDNINILKIDGKEYPQIIE
jgi:hypothetical protein